MNSEDKVDLSSVNKTKKQFKFPKISSLFRKKSAGPGRDAEGKFTSGSGGLISSKKFNVKRAAPIIIVVALVGGFFVFRSFAAVKLYAYQYSVASCTLNTGASTKESDKSCQNKSAEAFVFRLYQGMSNRKPDSGGYKYWTQKLAGDRTQPTTMANQFVAAKSIAEKTNQKFIDDLYTNLKLNGDAKGKAYWVGVLNSKSWSRGKVAAHFIASSEAVTAQSTATASYLAGAPKVKIIETAKKRQQERADKAKVYATVSKNQYEGMKNYVKNARLNRDAASNQANKSIPSRSDLSAIADNEKKVREYLTKTNNPLNKIKSNQKNLEKLAKEAAEVAKYSPDIPDNTIKSDLNKGKAYLGATGTIRNDLNYLIKKISESYKSAEGKYENEQKRIAEEAARNEANQSGGAGGAGGSEGETISSNTVNLDQAGCYAAATNPREWSSPITGGSVKLRSRYGWTGSECKLNTVVVNITCYSPAGYIRSGDGCVKAATTIQPSSDANCGRTMTSEYKDKQIAGNLYRHYKRNKVYRCTNGRHTTTSWGQWFATGDFYK